MIFSWSFSIKLSKINKNEKYKTLLLVTWWRNQREIWLLNRVGP